MRKQVLTEEEVTIEHDSTFASIDLYFEFTNGICRKILLTLNLDKGDPIITDLEIYSIGKFHYRYANILTMVNCFLAEKLETEIKSRIKLNNN